MWGGKIDPFQYLIERVLFKLHHGGYLAFVYVPWIISLMWSAFNIAVTISGFVIWRRMRKYSQGEKIDREMENQDYTALVPCSRCSAESVKRTVRSLINQTHKPKEVLVLINGITAKQKKRITRIGADHKNVRVIEVKQIGCINDKSCALNCGIDHVKTKWFCVVDADTVLKFHAVEHIFGAADDKTVAVGGRIKCDGLVQGLEYDLTFHTYRCLEEWKNSICLISGAFGMFKTSAVRLVGGYSEYNLAEDMELTIKLRKIGSVHYESQAVAITSGSKHIFDQRRRWSCGMGQNLDELPRGLAGLWYRLNYYSPVISLTGIVSLIFLAINHSVGKSAVAINLTLYGVWLIMAVIIEMLDGSFSGMLKALPSYVALSTWRYIEVLIARIVGMMENRAGIYYWSRDTRKPTRKKALFHKV